MSGKGFSSNILITPDHGALTGLEDDDHIQYHNDERGDERYLSKNNSSNFTPSADYQPATKKYVDSLVSAAGGGDMLTTVYDSNLDGKVNIADVADNVPWSGITGKPSVFPPETHNHDEMYYTETELQTAGQAQVHWDNITNIPAQGISNHGALIGLGNDDHPQYHNDLRGDIRYYQKSQVDGALADKADISHNHNSLYSPLSHNHNTAYSPLTHNHNSDYAQLSHGHDAEYLNKSNMAAYSPTSDYHPATKKYVDDTTAALGVGDMLTTVYDTNSDGKVNSADSADSVPWNGITNKPSSFPPDTHEHDERYYTESELQTAGQAQIHWNNITNTPTLGVTDHGALSGLNNDDHTQYHNDIRGDTRYYQKIQVDSALADKADISHNHNTIYSPLSHNHDTDYSPLSHNHDSDYAQLTHEHDAVYLSKTNTTQYTPAASYHPATKGYVDNSIAGLGNGDMLITIYDTNSDGKVNSADSADSVPWNGITNKPSSFPPDTHEHDTAYSTINHDHDTNYSALSHNHDGNYLGKTNITEYSPTSDYHPVTKKYVDDNIAVLGYGDMLRTMYDTNSDGKVNSADSADSVPWNGITDKPNSFPPDTHNHDGSYVLASDVSTSLDINKIPRCDANGDLNFAGNQALSFVIENRTSDPISPIIGQIWFRTDV